MQLIEGRSLRAILTEIEDTGAVDCVVGPDSSSSNNRSTLRSGSRTKNASGVPEVGRAYFRKVAHWIAEVADAMQYAHDHGVIHRDIKPSNLLLTEDGRLMISDFGLARPKNTHGLTGTNSLIGTARYMAPEQFAADANKPREDLHLVDVYALGATLYEMLAFRPVFSASDDRQVVYQIQNNDITPPSRFVRQIPIELETVCMKAISRDRKDRYASAEEFADDLRRWALDMPIHARRQSVPERMVRFVRRRKLIMTFAASSFLFASAAGGLYLRSTSAQADADRAIHNANYERASNLVLQSQGKVAEEQFELAIELADQALHILPNFRAALHARSVALLRMGRSEQSNAILRSAIADDPTDWKARFLLGMEIHGDHGVHPNTNPLNPETIRNPDDAVRISAVLGGYIADIERVHPGSPELLCLKSCVEPDHDRAIEMLDQAIELDPSLTYALVEKASRLGYLQQFNQALALLDEAIALGHGGHQIHGYRAIALYSLGSYTQAIGALTDAIQRFDGNSDWWYNRAVAYSYIGEYESTIADANRTLELNPQYAGAYMVRARAYTATNRANEALNDFSKAIEIDPNNGDIYVERGQLFWLAGMYDESLQDANTLIELEPTQLRGYQRRASTYLMLEKWDEALADLDTCESMWPNQETVHRLRGGVLFHAQRYEEAVESFSHSIGLLPTLYASYEYRAMALLRLGRHQEAIADLTNWISLDQNTHYALMRRGMVYEIMGEHSLAITDYANAGEYAEIGQYPELWSALLKLLQGDPSGPQILKSAHINAQSDPWMTSIIELFENQFSPSDLLAQADSESQTTEAQYYIGVYHQLNGDLDQAKSFYLKSANSRSLSVHEIDFAAARASMLNND